MGHASAFQEAGQWEGHVNHPDDSGLFEGMQGKISSEFWMHWQRLTNEPIKKEYSFLSCSC